MNHDRIQRDLQRLPCEFKNPAWIRGAVQSALLFNFGVEDRTIQSKHMVYLLELLYLQFRHSDDMATVREAIHAGVVALYIRGPAAERNPQAPMITVADLQEIAQAGDGQVHPLSRHMARKFLTHLNQPSATATQYAQVLSNSIESGDLKRFNALHKPLPLLAMPDLRQLESELLLEFPWMHSITETISREIRLAGCLGMNALRLRPLLLVGPPGTGKSRYARRLAEIIGMPKMTIACAGSADSMSVRGTSKGWSSSRPGVILELLQRHTSPQALILWDELDKASPSAHNGRLWDVCLQLMERETAHRYYDECLEMHCDLSWVNHVATANHINPLPRPLIERFHVMQALQPQAEHFEALLRGVLDDLAHEYRLVDRCLLPALDGDDRRTLLAACGLNPRLLARAVHRLLADKIGSDAQVLH
jgi:hypothetical protein